MFNNDEFLIIRRAILEAGAAIMDIYEAADMAVDHKADDSPVTAADLAGDRVIYAALAKNFPDEVIITEEKTDSHGLSASRFFIVDPLDGTKEFVQRRGDFTVNIGFVDDGVPVFGMVYAPAKGRLFYTRDGKAYEESGAFALDEIGDVHEIRVREADNTALAVVASKSHRDAATDAYIGQYQVADFQSAGSSMKFCLVAAGEADLYPRLGPTMEWDTAAADALTRAAGGEVLDFETHHPMQYGKPEFRNGFFIVRAANVELIG